VLVSGGRPFVLAGMRMVPWTPRPCGPGRRADPNAPPALTSSREQAAARPESTGSSCSRGPRSRWPSASPARPDTPNGRGCQHRPKTLGLLPDAGPRRKRAQVWGAKPDLDAAVFGEGDGHGRDPPAYLLLTSWSRSPALPLRCACRRCRGRLGHRRGRARR
jgi:hypothetical protein